MNNVFPIRHNAQSGDAKVYTDEQLAIIKSYAWCVGFFSAFGVVSVLGAIAFWGAK